MVGNCWMMIAVKHTRRPELQGDYLDVVEQYKDYILGEYVYGQQGKDSEGSTIAIPPWCYPTRGARKQANEVGHHE